MRLCEACERARARPRSRWCSDRCKRRARRRWEHGLPANALPRAAKPGELIYEKGRLDGERAYKPLNEKAGDLAAIVDRIGWDGLREAAESTWARRRQAA